MLPADAIFISFKEALRPVAEELNPNRGLIDTTFRANVDMGNPDPEEPDSTRLLAVEMSNISHTPLSEVSSSNPAIRESADRAFESVFQFKIIVVAVDPDDIPDATGKAALAVRQWILSDDYCDLQDTYEFYLSPGVVETPEGDEKTDITTFTREINFSLVVNVSREMTALNGA